MTSSVRRIILALCIFAALTSALVCGLVVTRTAVSKAHRDLLRQQTTMAVELYRGSTDTANLRSVFGTRWRLGDEVRQQFSEATVFDTIGTVYGAATVFDADSWFEIGTLYLSAGSETSDTLPTLVLLVSALALTGVAYFSLVVVKPCLGQRFHRLVFPTLSFIALSVPLGLGLGWANGALKRAAESRIRAGAETLALMPDLDSLKNVPGGITHVTGAFFVLRDIEGNVEFSTLPTTATDELHNADIRGIERVTADRVEYLTTDVSDVRLAVLPYDETFNPVPTVCVLIVLGLLLAALPVSLTRLVDQPRAFRRHVVAWSFLAPASVHLAVFTLGPLAAAAWLSLHRWSLVDMAKPFVGLANYVSLMSDAAYWNAIKNTVVFTLHVPVSMAVALGLAMLVQRRARGIVFLRAMLFLPTITSLVAIAMIWQWMLHDEYGLFNWLLSFVGVDPVHWLSSPSTALLSIMILATWMVVGYQMVLFQAGLAAIPADLYDAARIDGAGAWSRFWHVTIPGLRHTLFFVLVTSVIGSFQVFGAVYVMTEGGPLHATDVAVFHIYKEAWEFLRFGDAAAQSWVLFAIVFVATWLQFRTLERRAEEGV